MITQTIDRHHFVGRAQQIRAQVPHLLSQWGLTPRFKRWRLAQDPDTGMVVLFGVLNTKYIATHTTTPFSDYFDPRLLRDLANALHVQVMPSANDGLRYAFILERGQLEPSPVSLEQLEHYQAIKTSRAHLQKGVIAIRTAPHRLNNSILVDDQTMRHQRLDKFLKLSEALDVLNEATVQPRSGVLPTDEAEFFQKLAWYEDSRHSTPSTT